MNKPVTNEDILELLQESMQISSEQFTRIDQRFTGIDQRFTSIDQRFEKIDERFDNIEGELRVMNSTLSSHGQDLTELKEGVRRISNEQRAQVSDISNILDRLDELEKRGASITPEEKEEAKRIVTEIISWAQKASKNLGIPLNI